MLVSVFTVVSCLCGPMVLGRRTPAIRMMPVDGDELARGTCALDQPPTAHSGRAGGRFHGRLGIELSLARWASALCYACRWCAGNTTVVGSPFSRSRIGGRALQSATASRAPADLTHEQLEDTDERKDGRAAMTRPTTVG